MKTKLKWIGSILGLFAVLFFLWSVAEGPKKAAADEDDEQEAVKIPSRVSVVNGQTVITLDAAAQAQMGLTIATLQQTSSREQIQAPAIVLSAQELVGLRRAYLTALTNVDKARVSATVSQQEYQRLKTLYQDQQNASEKSVQSAEAVWRTNQVDVEAAQRDVVLERAAVVQRWGPVIAQWLTEDTAPFEQALSQQSWLVQVTVPFGKISGAPRAISLHIPGGERMEARLVSAFPRTDPRIQGDSFLYLTAAYPGLAPDVMLTAYLGVGGTLKGVVAPEAALVWWKGQAWVYRQVSATQFVRRAVDTTQPVAQGVFVTAGLSPGDKVVVHGSQMLLSEEFRSQIQAED